MDLHDAIHAYFRGERQLGLLLGLFGITALGMGWHVLSSMSGGFQRGLSVTLLLLGLGFLGGGTVLAMKSGPQAERLEAALAQQGEPALRAELTRMARVNANWSRVKAAWTVILVMGLALIWLNRWDLPTGVAVALVAMAGLLMYTDTSAERRAQVYTTALEQRAAR